MKSVIFIFLFLLIPPMAQSQTLNFYHAQMANKCGQIRKSCAAHLAAGCNVSKNYKIKITGETQVLNLYCDQQTDGGGWTLVAKIERNVTPGNLDFEGTVTNNSQLTSNSSTPVAGNGLNVADLSGLMNNTLFNRSGYAVKLSNARINALKSSTASTVAAYRVERMNTPSGPNLDYFKLFYPGSCVFQKHQFGSFGSNVGCQQEALTHNATSFASNGGTVWCVQNNMPSQYFCSGAARGMTRLNDSYTNSSGHNYFDTILWVR